MHKTKSYFEQFWETPLGHRRGQERSKQATKGEQEKRKQQKQQKLKIHRNNDGTKQERISRRGPRGDVCKFLRRQIQAVVDISPTMP